MALSAAAPTTGHAQRHLDRLAHVFKAPVIDVELVKRAVGHSETRMVVADERARKRAGVVVDVVVGECPVRWPLVAPRFVSRQVTTVGKSQAMQALTAADLDAALLIPSPSSHLRTSELLRTTLLGASADPFVSWITVDPVAEVARSSVADAPYFDVSSGVVRLPAIGGSTALRPGMDSGVVAGAAPNAAAAARVSVIISENNRYCRVAQLK